MKLITHITSAILLCGLTFLGLVVLVNSDKERADAKNTYNAIIMPSLGYEALGQQRYGADVVAYRLLPMEWGHEQEGCEHGHDDDPVTDVPRRRLRKFPHKNGFATGK